LLFYLARQKSAIMPTWSVGETSAFVFRSPQAITGAPKGANETIWAMFATSERPKKRSAKAITDSTKNKQNPTTASLPLRVMPLSWQISADTGWNTPGRKANDQPTLTDIASLVQRVDAVVSLLGR
jgi:hypothetical protein